MPKYHLQLLFLLFFAKATAQTTPIPDANFEQDLINKGIDTNGANGTILNSDAQAVTSYIAGRNDITDFTGLEAFVNVTSLNLGTNLFTDLPLNTLINLEELIFSNNSALVNLDLSSNTNLKTFDVRANFFTNSAPITTIDLSANINLEDILIDDLANLQNIILPNTTTLKNLYILSKHDLNVDLAVYDNLETLHLEVAPLKLIAFNLPNVKTSLKSITLNNGNINTINLSGFSALEFICLSRTYVVNFTPPSSAALSKVNIVYHKISSPLSFTGAPNLDELTITNNDTNVPLQLDLSNNSALKILKLNSNKMVSLNITQNTALTSLNVSKNDLTTIDTSQNTLLNNINGSENKITTLDFSTNVLLNQIDLDDNMLPQLVLTNNVALVRLFLGFNKLTDLDVTTNVMLTALRINNNLFTTTGLDVTQNTVLEEIDASFNQIESLDISQNIQLEDLIINNNLLVGNSILNDFYQAHIASGRKIFRNNRLIVHDNKLSGAIPNFKNIVKEENQPDDTYNFRFELQNNNFHFGDFEAVHDQYIFYRDNGSPQYGSLKYFITYLYAPQNKVNTIENLNPNAGETITLSTTVRGTQNHYKWFKNGIEIADAPDAPEYIITNINTCNAGVYHSEIISDLMPFENVNVPGTNGKNLLLIRNDINVTVNASKSCVSLSDPLNGATNVPVNTGLTWNDNPGACGYKISVGTSSGGSDLVNNLDVGEVTGYNFNNDLPSNQDIFVTITPYYNDGDFGGCLEESFTTGNTSTLPECTNLVSPINGATDISESIDYIAWNPANGADEYKLTITSTSGTNNLPETNVGNVLSYSFGNDFQSGDVVTVTIVPVNTIGEAVGPCASESFTIAAAAPTPPSCTTLTAPLANATDVAVGTDISWNAATDATSYLISISSTSGNNNITDFDNGNNLTYNPPIDFDNDDVVTVTITPLNGTVQPTSTCASESFTIVAAAPTPPSCTTLTAPLANATDVAIGTDISWNAATDATSYLISISSTSGNNNITDFDNGNNLTYNPPIDFDNDDVVTVTITPLNGTVQPTSTCASESFTIVAAAPTPPSCTTLTAPLANATDVAVGTDISWNAATDATAYLISISSTSGNNNITDFDNGNNLTYNPPIDFDNDDVVTVTITPLNGTVQPTSTCASESFTIEEKKEDPITKVDSQYGFSPDGDGVNDFWEINGIENYPDNVVTIFNRWGDVVFQIEGYNNYSKVFQGEANKSTKMGAGRLPSGTYFFDIKIIGEHNLNKTRGYLILKR